MAIGRHQPQFTRQDTQPSSLCSRFLFPHLCPSWVPLLIIQLQTLSPWAPLSVSSSNYLLFPQEVPYYCLNWSPVITTYSFVPRPGKVQFPWLPVSFWMVSLLSILDRFTLDGPLTKWMGNPIYSGDCFGLSDNLQLNMYRRQSPNDNSWEGCY